MSIYTAESPFRLDLSPYKAVIFDMDGVIVDSELHWKSLEGFFLRSLVPHWTPQDQSKIIGLSLDSLYAMLRDTYGMTETQEAFLEQYHKMAAGIYQDKANLLPGFRDLLNQLLERKMPLAIASSSHQSWIAMVVVKFKLHSAFPVIVSAQQVGGRGKPAPDIYLYTAEMLSVKPEDCVVIEDSKNGVLSAKNAGMFCIGIRNGFNEEQDISAADVIIEGYEGLQISAPESEAHSAN